jgi:threonine dehydrogenase-like Zn-dependent dehydrogenase
VEVGKNVDDFRIGDYVAAMPAAGCGACAGCRTGNPFLCHAGPQYYFGGFARYLRVASRTAVQLSKKIAMADAALVEPLSVSLHGVALAKLTPNARVLVLGAGSIGLGVIYWARKLGAGRIAAASRSNRRAELAGRMGADAFVQTGEGEAGRVTAALGGPPDVVFECIGVFGALSQAINFIRPDGIVVSLGACIEPDPIVPGLANFKQARLMFSMCYTLSEFQYAANIFERGQVEPSMMVSAPISLEDVPRAIDALRSGSISATKIQVDPWI